MRSRVSRARFALLVVSLFWASGAQAEIPAFYTGTPYLGTPRAIPGRIDFADVDLGGQGMAWDTDHNRGTDAPQSGDDYRPDDLALPNINKTNRFLVDQTWSEDFWEDGTRYPSEAEPHAYYLGASHAGDWVRITVNVQQAGVYNVSSNWACESGPMCGCSIWFNDGSDPAAPEDGVNKSGIVMLDSTGDYHAWREYPNFAQVELSAGLQVMTFYVEVADHLQYSFLQFDLEGGGTGGTGGTGGAAGSAGTTSGGTAGEPAAGGVSAGGTGGGTAGSAPSGAGAGGMPGSAGSAGAPTTPMAPAVANSDAKTDSSCALTHQRPSSRAPLLLLTLLAAAGLTRRRRP